MKKRKKIYTEGDLILACIFYSVLGTIIGLLTTTIIQIIIEL